MRIVFVAPYIPSRIRVRPYNLLRTLVRRGHNVTLLALQPPGDDGEALPELRQWCKQVQVIPHSRNRALFNGLKALPGRSPVQAAYSESPGFDEMARDLLARESFEVAHVEHLRGAVLAKSLGNLPVVFDSVDSISLLFSKVLQDAPSLKSRVIAALDLSRTRQFEGQLTRRFSQVTVTSEADRQALVELGCDNTRVTVVPNGVDLDYFGPQTVERNPLQLVFTGKMSYHANIAAVQDLVEQIMPLVWARQPDVHLQIVGKDPPSVILALGENPKILITGYVPDLRPHLAQAAVAVSTVRYGVGIQNKVLEAMAMATPVVCSTQASSALRIQNGRDLLVGDTPEAIAQHILDLLASPEKRNALGDAGRRFVETYHSWDNAVSLLENLYASAQG
jgi:sugar transferase (PEP-CTERM/EpsH1 system associated)